MSLTVKINAEFCAGSGQCVAAAPRGFKLDANDLAIVLEPAGSLPRDALIRIAKACPTLAISLFDGDEEIDPFVGDEYSD